MYEYISSAELTIHRLVKKLLQGRFGNNEEEWWRQGIPLAIRTRCVTRREEDAYAPAEPYSYTTLIDLSTIISKNWLIFQETLPSEYGANQQELKRDLVRLNHLRNAVMHPVKESKWTEDDFEFARAIFRRFESSA